MILWIWLCVCYLIRENVWHWLNGWVAKNWFSRPKHKWIQPRVVRATTTAKYPQKWKINAKHKWRLVAIASMIIGVVVYPSYAFTFHSDCRHLKEPSDERTCTRTHIFESFISFDCVYRSVWTTLEWLVAVISVKLSMKITPRKNSRFVAAVAAVVVIAVHEATELLQSRHFNDARTSNTRLFSSLVQLGKVHKSDNADKALRLRHTGQQCNLIEVTYK